MKGKRKKDGAMNMIVQNKRGEIIEHNKVQKYQKTKLLKKEFLSKGET